MMNDDMNNTAPSGTDRNTNPATAPDGHVYTALGESGLVQDEEGNIYNASEIYDDEVTNSLYGQSPLPDSFKKSSFVSQLDDKSNPAYWYFYYDERYCGPSREAYAEQMALRYRQASSRKPAKQVAPQDTVAHAPTASSEAESSNSSLPQETQEQHTVSNAVADQQQREADREGLHPAYHNFAVGTRTCGLVDRRGNVIVPYGEYSVIGYFHNGLARVVKQKTGRFGFIDIHGKEVIPCKWLSAGEFSEYLAGVKDDNGRCGYVDVAGRLVIPCKWDESWPFQEGLARVMSNGKLGMIGRRGQLVIPCIWSGIGDIGEGLIGVQNPGGRCGYIDKKGRTVLPCRWKNVWPFSEDRAIVQADNGLFGFIDKQGRLVIPCQWKKAESFKDGKARVTKEKRFFLIDKWVYIDRQGQVLN